MQCPLLVNLKLSLAEHTQTLLFMSESSYSFLKQLSFHVTLLKNENFNFTLIRKSKIHVYSFFLYF